MTEHKFTDDEIIKAVDICDKFDFFGGQRAGRELWFEKPVEIQDDDIRRFAEDVQFVKSVINRQKAEIERLRETIVKGDWSSYTARVATEAWHRTNSEHIRRIEAEIERLERLRAELSKGVAYWQDEAVNAKREAVKEFAERLKDKITCIPQHHFTLAEVLFDIYNLVKEMIGETK